MENEDFKIAFHSDPMLDQLDLTKKFEAMYTNMVKRCLDATIHVLDTYIEFWSEKSVQEFYYDVSPLEVLNEVKQTLITGEFPSKMEGLDEEQ